MLIFVSSFMRRNKALTAHTQSVSLIAPGVPQFTAAQEAIGRIFEYCEQHFTEGAVVPFLLDSFGTVSQIKAATCYLTSIRNHQFASAPVPALIDPHFFLRGIVNDGRARFTADNIVEYDRISVMPDSQ
jgi:hypothetical protein